MSTLREIGADLQALEALLYEAGGDVSDEEANAAVDGWLKEVSGALSTKLDGYGSLIASAEARAKIRQEEAERLRSLAGMDVGLVKRLKNRLLFFMDSLGKAELQSKLYRFRTASNGGNVPVEFSSEWTPDRVADVYGPHSQFLRTVRYEWDVDTIREILERGHKLPFAKLGERGRHLRIR